MRACGNPSFHRGGDPGHRKAGRAGDARPITMEGLVKEGNLALQEVEETGNMPSRRGVLRSTYHVLYILFNSACTILYAWQIYIWIRRGAWKSVPWRVLIPSGNAWHLSAASGPAGKALHWILNVELAYVLCVVAIVFYFLRWLADRKR